MITNENSIWPITNPTYGTYDWLALSVGVYLNWGASTSGWDELQSQKIDWIVQQGVAMFYNPPPVQGQVRPHVWSFLMDKATLSLSNTDWDYDLPSTFGGVFTEVTHQVGDAQRRLKIVDEHTIRSLQAKDNQTATPLYVASRPKAVVLTAEQAFEAIFYPTPDASYTLEYRFKVNHAALSTTNKYPLGTRSHSQTIVLACLAVAEMMEHRAPAGMYDAFIRQLQASLQLDALHDREPVMGAAA